MNMKKILKLVFTCILIIACDKSDETINIDSKTNAEILKVSFDLFSKMKKENQNLVMNLSLNNEGKIVATYKNDTNIFSKSTPELLCKDETYTQEFADCVKENVEAGVCVSVSTCAYCAHECIDSQ